MPSTEPFEDAITDIPEVRDTLNELTSDGQRQRQILQLFYTDLPKWVKCRETLEAKFRVKIVELELMVSKGYTVETWNSSHGKFNDLHSTDSDKPHPAGENASSSPSTASDRELSPW
ncbi:hypothetical protein CES85_3213 (plasmid) [Ochrobactrum quorumnocens]|uniref:Uncharacterized protein n=1 Tax=Ochrobactrum quorumnocens TaxID=271865 RepID=A0A248UQA3_9HYPH|nr:hypothetical protein CES85_3213 [[Ochrobactrum] quorumnocens]